MRQLCKRQAQAPSIDESCFPPVFRCAKIIFCWRRSCHRVVAMATSAQIVAELIGRKSMSPYSCLEHGENLAFSNNVVNADENELELARRGRGDGNFHLHGFDEGDVVAVADAAADFNRKRADAS